MQSSAGWIGAGVLLAGLWWFSAALYAGLPQRIPGHFGFDGGVTRWASREEFWWLPAVATGLALLVFGLTRLAFRYPAILNLPQKELFLSLPEEQRNKVVRGLDFHLALLMGLVCALFGYLQWKTYLVALGAAKGLGWEIWLFLAAVFLLIAWMYWDTNHRLRQIQRTL
ncbi:DUF1648 domain-containing protein [Meiothermus taiwanensis]|uniref:DUF1648 domain-containing protein n=2 Tax=Meiothermus taiwanensis TaxID=172827 RepID=A0A399DZE5_9DEIN|nr:DUF1648 domain-containing protein [Meiothermus taiwanensis]AWR86124.1 hypothetical protein Mtai_v1c08800 [Meiothermus taiwanensis WR-220]KIQ53462.1 hypothetical protein SY28_13770 [Meiothermus taiwanensis]KZK15013.1 hypothetical protein A3962_02710 [Meiothermus taiwanensis]RIH76753.1 hypothetical protein Mcate_01644 [Meiothermus taiwanensis]